MNRWLLVVLLAGSFRMQAVPADAHCFSTLFTAQDVRQYLSSDAGIAENIQWCKTAGLTKVYLEEYRDGYQADRPTLIQARDRFRAEGFAVSGCVTTTGIGKKSDHWKVASCYSDLPTQDQLQSKFEYAAGLFDEIMIDDFWFTDCACSNCNAARLAQQITVGSKVYPVSGTNWSDFRCELMLRLSQDRILAPAKRANPKVKVIIKYPQWYDDFQNRGYDVARETAKFDRIWVGTETRDYTNSRWGGCAQYEGYFIMRWLGGIGGEKCGGGWYDTLGTTPHTYIEQARQTVLAGARESFLFSYSGLLHGTGAADVAALRTNMPELQTVAREVREHGVIGIAAYKPANSPGQNESRVFDFVGMMGLPLAPCHEFPTKAPAIFLSVHALADPNLVGKLASYIATGRPVLLTDGLTNLLEGRVNFAVSNVVVLPVESRPKSLLALAQPQLDAIRAPMLAPFHATFLAPNKVALYLFTQGGWVVENFNDAPVDVALNGQPMTIAARGWSYHWNN